MDCFILRTKVPYSNESDRFEVPNETPFRHKLPIRAPRAAVTPHFCQSSLPRTSIRALAVATFADGSGRVQGFSVAGARVRGAVVENGHGFTGEVFGGEVATEHVRRIARRRLARLGVPEQDLEDLVQDTVAALLRSEASYDFGRGSIPAWVSGFASNIAKRWWRQRAARVRIESPLEDGETLVQEPRTEWIGEVLAGALDRLSPEDKELLRLRYQYGLTFVEIEQLTSLPASTSRKRVSRSLARLRSQFGLPGSNGLAPSSRPSHRNFPQSELSN